MKNIYINTLDRNFFFFCLVLKVLQCELGKKAHMGVRFW